VEFNKLAIIIPAFNEAETISNVIASVSRLGTVIVVDDGSIDCTADVARSSGAITVSHKINLGYEQALNSGFEQANALGMANIITMDADGQHKAKCVAKVAQALTENYQLVLGVRHKTQRISEKIFQRVTSRLWEWRDPLCGLKGYSIDLYRNAGFFDRHHSAGIELAFFGLSNGYKCKQIEILVADRADAPRFASTLRANWRILRSLLRVLFQKNSLLKNSNQDNLR
tara:strand:- start:4025 stop:4708 length:684 start_codon:yes stop_codon:yes gene_type:complete